MNLFHQHNPPIKHPAPPRDWVSKIRTGVGLFGAPSAWLAQFSLSEPLAAHACYPYQSPLPAPIWEGLPLLLAAISVACLAIALLSGFIALSSWRQSELKRTEEKISGIGTGDNPNRFLAQLSLMSSVIFIVAIVFNICALMLAPLCSSWF